MEKILYPTQPNRCTITGPSECCESVFLTKLTSKNTSDYHKMYIYSPSLHQDFVSKLN